MHLTRLGHRARIPVRRGGLLAEQCDRLEVRVGEAAWIRTHPHVQDPQHAVVISKRDGRG